MKAQDNPDEIIMQKGQVFYSVINNKPMDQDYSGANKC